MALDRWIALIFVAFCCVYGYTAFFTMDHLLPPFMQRNPVWPSTFPKMLAVLGVGLSLIVLLGVEQSADGKETSSTDIDYRRLGEYKIGQALLLLALMAAYAMLLRPAGFLLATTGFLVAGSTVLGERKCHIMIPVSVLATVGVWYLVQEVLGIFLRPFPFFLGN